MRTRKVIMPIVLGLTLSGCHCCCPEPPQPTNSFSELAILVENSPCDVLPESGPIVGELAHSRGYPHWSKRYNTLVWDSTSALHSPDSSVVWALTGGPTYENEVHDCQRLVMGVSPSLTFGPLVGVFPLDPAMTLEDADFSTPQEVATVVNWGGFDQEVIEYDALGIRDGWNCLWLRSDNGWRATVTRRDDVPCAVQDAPSGSYNLDVLRVYHPELRNTARWGWSEARSSHLIGVKCGSAWCWVGPQAHWNDTTQHLAQDEPSPSEGDEQHLAVPGAGGIVPGPFARVVPSDELRSLARQQEQVPKDTPVDLIGPPFRTAAGLHVAQITIPAPTPKPYDEIWGPTSPLEVWLALRDTLVTDDQSGVTATDTIVGVTFTDTNGGGERTTVGTRIPGMAHAAVGAVRWRWHDTSSTESIWSACGEEGTDCCDTGRKSGGS